MFELNITSSRINNFCFVAQRSVLSLLIVNHCSFKWAIVWLILRPFIFSHLLHFLDHSLCIMHMPMNSAFTMDGTQRNNNESTACSLLLMQITQNNTHFKMAKYQGWLDAAVVVDCPQSKAPLQTEVKFPPQKHKSWSKTAVPDKARVYLTLHEKRIAGIDVIKFEIHCVNESNQLCTLDRK